MMAVSLIFADPSNPPRVQWVIFTAPAVCVPCVKAEADFKPNLRKAGLRVGPEVDAHVRLIDIYPSVSQDGPADAAIAVEASEAAAMAETAGIETIPTFILMVNGKQKRRFIGYPGWKFMLREFLRQNEGKYEVPK